MRYGVTFVVLFVTLAFTAEAGAAPSAASVAAHCAAGLSINAPLNASDYGLLRSLLSCALHRLRPRVPTPAALGRDAQRAVATMVAAHSSSYATKSTTVSRADRLAAAAFCAGRQGGFMGEESDSSPPAMTPLDAVQQLLRALSPTVLPVNAPVGFGYARHVLFHQSRQKRGLAFIVIRVACR
jgi:hypothetical protein